LCRSGTKQVYRPSEVFIGFFDMTLETSRMHFWNLTLSAKLGNPTRAYRLRR
jgi:hypothetical protein